MWKNPGSRGLRKRGSRSGWKFCLPPGKSRRRGTHTHTHTHTQWEGVKPTPGEFTHTHTHTHARTHAHTRWEGVKPTPGEFTHTHTHTHTHTQGRCEAHPWGVASTCRKGNMKRRNTLQVTTLGVVSWGSERRESSLQIFQIEKSWGRNEAVRERGPQAPPWLGLRTER